jgi:hypothetical protein
MSPLKKELMDISNCFAFYLTLPVEGLKDTFSFEMSLRATGRWFAGNMFAASCVLSGYALEIARCIVLLQS